ncbi:ABC transporter substrate-binding protein [Brachybacterium sp. GCM10030252]|uniref:ABC transporter substrate-binding protein n=1 Tax=Brachybacterium sp. GCM10030252 TaxID=3273380 RepID=UPI00360CE7D6
MDRRRFSLTALTALATLGTAACSGGSATEASDAGGTGAGRSAAEGSDGGGTTATGFPLQIENCESQLSFDAPPHRIMLLETAPVTTLDGLGALDLVIGRAGTFSPGYYSEELSARIEQIPALSEDVDAAGHLQISQELVIAQQPDLVLGLPDGITREGMRAAGAEVLVQNVFCAGTERASFEQLDEEIAVYGQILDRAEPAERLTTELHERIDAVTAAAQQNPSAARTAAVLYPSVGGGPLYAYGAASMVTAQLDAVGLANVFEDTAERVFEVGAEPLLEADPDVVIVLHKGQRDGSEIAREMVASDRLSSLRAVTEQTVLPLLFNFCEPASPLVVDGLERIHTWLAEQEPAA